MAKTTWQRGKPLKEPTQEQLRALLKEKGEKAAAELLEIGVISVVRAAAGLGLRRGTMKMIEIGLSSLGRAA